MPARPPELTVYDEPHACQYLPGRVARLPLRFPIRRLTRAELDRSLAEGDRRQGVLLYRTACPDCRACEPIRVDVDAFRPGKTHRRVLRAGDRALGFEVVRPSYDDAKLALYEKHKAGRDLASVDDETLDARGYKAFLVDTCCDTIELDYRDRATGALVGVALADRGATSLSAVYCHWDPAYARLSPGAYSILKQIELCRRFGLRWLYLGLYVANNEHMAYKARWLPHERLVDGAWRRFDALGRAAE
jgi:arginine-tRNA-protein transferase